MTAKATKKPLEIVDVEEIERILEHARASLSEEEHRKLTAAIETLAYLTSRIEDKKTTIRHLRKLLFGSKSEKTDRVLGKETEEDESPSADQTDTAAAQSGEAEENESNSDGESGTEKKPKKKGHGRNGAKEYVGAQQIDVPHESLKPGCACPDSPCKGTLYRLREPKVIVRLRGQAPVAAEVYHLERVRCNLCLKIYTASAPEGVGEKKYDETSAAMIALLKYGSGLPFNRLARLEGNLGIPLPVSTQWDIVNELARTIEEAFAELIRQGAQADVVHNDDTTMKILELMKENRERILADDDPGRSGIFTSGIVTVKDDLRIALFFTGREHAGENLAKILAEREAELEPPIQMCDALSRNVSKEFETIVANCLSHARRMYVDVVENFPQEVRFVLETLREVFRNEATARKLGLSAEERLAYHREKSLREMAKLRFWMYRQLRDRLVEPNSGLGKAIAYMQKHWRKLTRFLFVAGAPLENNICERSLKRAIIHRKNSLFYKTQNGARVGDLFMSLIATCQLSKVNPFDYLVELQRHAAELAEDPAAWMPWSYRSTLERATDSVTA